MARKTRLLVLSLPSESAIQIRSALSRSPLFEVHYEQAAKAAVTYLSEHDIDCLILNIEKFSSRQIPLLEQIRSLGYTFQIFIFAEKTIIDADLFYKFPRAVLFSRASLDLEADLIGLCSRFLKNQGRYARKAKRFSTSQKTFVENVLRGSGHWGLLTNLSKSGGFLELATASLNLGDLVKLTLNLDRIKTTRTVNAEIVWIGTTSYGRHSVGLHFLQPAEFYGRLFEKM